MTRLQHVTAVVVLVAAGGGCAGHRLATTPAARHEMIVLLPDPDDGSVGRAIVSTPTGTAELAGAYAATRLVAERAPSPVMNLDRAYVERLFHGVLAGLPPPPRHFNLYFESGQDALTPESREELSDVLHAAGDHPAANVIVVGHTDTVGTAASNYALGLRRAAIIGDLLMSAGIPAGAVEVTSHGESDLLVPTGDETSEPRNRRVEIDVQ